MAGFCTKCGAPLASSTGFCSACGTPIGTDVVPSAAAAAPPPAGYPAAGAAPPVAYPAAYPPPTKSSGGALKVILIIVAVVVVLGALGVAAIGFTAWRVAKSVKVNAGDSGVSVSVPGGGTFSAGDNAGNDADLGVPIYPGAEREKGGVQMRSASASMVMAHFSTSDSISQVSDFYKGKIGDSAQVVSSNEGTVITSGADSPDKITITVAPGNGDDKGKTTILILRAKKNSGS
jgi:hypothetical protein